MKKLESTITNMVVVLVGVALITGSILAYVNHVTEEPIKLQAEKTLADGIKAVMGGVELSVAKEDTVKQNVSGKELTFVIHEAVAADGRPIGAAVESTSGGFGGDLKILVGFDSDGKILGYTITKFVTFTDIPACPVPGPLIIRIEVSALIQRHKHVVSLGIIARIPYAIIITARQQVCSKQVMLCIALLI